MDRMTGSKSGELDIVQFVAQVHKNFLNIAPQVKETYLEFWDLKKNLDPTEPKPVTS